MSLDRVGLELFSHFVFSINSIPKIHERSDCATAAQLSTILFEVKRILLFAGIGRLLFGKLSDIPFISRNGNRIVLQQV